MSWDATGEPILHVDATPDDEYPLRILRAHRRNCNLRWVPSCDPDRSPNELCAALNTAQEHRAAILDRAIEILEQALPEWVPYVKR